MEIVHASLSDFFSYWQKKKGGRIAPARREIRPNEIPVPVLPYIYMIDVIPGQPRRFRFRLVGTGIVTEYGSDPTGKFVDEVDLDFMTNEIIAEYDRVASSGQPAASRWKYTKLDGRMLEYEHVILPLSDDGKTVDVLLGAAMIKGVG